MTKKNKNRTEHAEFARGLDLSPDDLEVDKNYAERHVINKKEIMKQEKGRPQTFR